MKFSQLMNLSLLGLTVLTPYFPRFTGLCLLWSYSEICIMFLKSTECSGVTIKRLSFAFSPLAFHTAYPLSRSTEM